MIECLPGAAWMSGQRPLTSWLPAGTWPAFGPDRADDELPKKRRLKQYFSSAPLARMMASMMDYSCGDVRILDPGAGEGALFTACVERACALGHARSVSVTAYEVDPDLWNDLGDALGRAGDMCRAAGVPFQHTLAKSDFMLDCAAGTAPGGFTHVVANPPYGKLPASSGTHAALCRAGIHTTNTYSAFVALSQNLLRHGGQMVFISPRSFCNGAYFDRFRAAFLGTMSLRNIHLFGSRTAPFRDDGILQETIIVCAEKGGRRSPVRVSTSPGPEDSCVSRLAPYGEVVHGGDPRRIMHVVLDEAGARVAASMRRMECTLDDLGMGVSTGRVIAFRARAHITRDPDGAVPYVQPLHMVDGAVSFPANDPKRPEYILDDGRSADLLVGDGNYVLVKRISATEEARRVVAAVYAGGSHARVGFDNQTNYVHCGRGGGLDMRVAHGLCAYLNSDMVDAYVRQFNGGIHVNAADLRYLRYPPLDELVGLGVAPA